jgi:hypothetical protein
MKFKVDSARHWFLGYRTWPRSPETRTPQIYGKHTCGCSACDPLLEFHGECHSPAFFTVERDYGLQPLLEGQELNYCVELMTGTNGWALMASRPVHLCDICGKEYCRYRIYSDHLSVTTIPEHKDA